MILPVDFFIVVPVHVPLNLSQMEQFCSTSSVLGESGTIIVSGFSIPQSSGNNLEKETNDKQAWEASKPFTKIKLPPPKNKFTLSQSIKLLVCSFEKKKIDIYQHILGSVFCGTFFRYRNISGHNHSSYEHRSLRICYSNSGQKYMYLHACPLSSKQGTIN